MGPPFWLFVVCGLFAWASSVSGGAPHHQHQENVQTPLGIAEGIVNGSAVRFSVKYASAERWKESQVVSTWSLPNGFSDANKMPLACPQGTLDASAYSEDCLSMVLYVPRDFLASGCSDAPTFMWIHGGSFTEGFASDYGLDGSIFAVATNSIVAVVQYRLGALGFMVPDGNANLAVKDMINAMKFLQTVVRSFGGNSSKITLAGQSAGAMMIRSLLAAPSASSLFQSAIIQSDPMNYGFLNISTQQTLQSYYNELIVCDSTNSTCWESVSVDEILEAQTTLYNNASAIDASASFVIPLRPVRDDVLITTPLDSTAKFPAVTKPILITSVLDEAAATIYDLFPDIVPQTSFDAILSELLGADRAATVVSSSYYQSNESDARDLLVKLGTDYVWRCPDWTMARNWVNNGGSAFVGLFTVGAHYYSNANIPFCQEEGAVCHSDDIEIVFGTVSNPDIAQAKLISQIQQRYKSFLNAGHPNPLGLPEWPAAGKTKVHTYKLGECGKVKIGACTPAFWGSAVEYDYQVYDI
ncbi:alpha/beta-hydrolase [Guyanagaster necrorhizus]|uniref:Carboxylic ester hydrolase n=1 Tax=Guyanagaster necrorhizus TaxID=856835 RepID=A0A9P7W442_9AGAR|nr:alpha/beta-hydrolase [Guyanagaster necrorhizus MCA 3950]KAG7451620.1 alpha/beta-hydrolase [Guyanagaster necrorhizus MCA 3950]